MTVSVSQSRISELSNGTMEEPKGKERWADASDVQMNEIEYEEQGPEEEQPDEEEDHEEKRHQREEGDPMNALPGETENERITRLINTPLPPLKDHAKEDSKEARRVESAAQPGVTLFGKHAYMIPKKRKEQGPSSTKTRIQNNGSPEKGTLGKRKSEVSTKSQPIKTKKTTMQEDEPEGGEEAVCHGLNVGAQARSDATRLYSMWFRSQGQVIYVLSPIHKAPLFATIVNTTYIIGYRPCEYSKWIEELSSTYKDVRNSMASKSKKDMQPPGSATLVPALKEDDYDVITIISRLRKGLSRLRKDAPVGTNRNGTQPEEFDPEDSPEVRQKWFLSGLIEANAKYPEHTTVMALPYCIGAPEGKFTRNQRQEHWQRFHQTLCDFVALTNTCVLVFMGTPEGATLELQQKLENANANNMKTEVMQKEVGASDQLARSDPKLLRGKMSKRDICNVINNRIKLRITGANGLDQ